MSGTLHLAFFSRARITVWHPYILAQYPYIYNKIIYIYIGILDGTLDRFGVRVPRVQGCRA
jgi:hypothetical protein